MRSLVNHTALSIIKSSINFIYYINEKNSLNCVVFSFLSLMYYIKYLYVYLCV